MAVIFRELADNEVTYNPVAIVRDGQIQGGADRLPDLSLEQLSDESELVERFDGPYLIAAQEPVTEQIDADVDASPTDKTHVTSVRSADKTPANK